MMKQRLAAFILIAISMGIFQHYEKKYVTANEYIRYFSILAWDDEHSVSLDPVFARLFPGWKDGDTPPNDDCAKVNGHYFLDKAPGLTILGAVLHPIIKLFIDPWHQGWIELQILTFLLISLPSLLFLFLLLFRGKQSNAAILLFATGTPFLLYSTVFFGILPAGIVAYAGYMLATRRKKLFLGGLTVGAAVLLEYPAAILIAAISAVVFFSDMKWHEKLSFFLGFLPIVVIQLGYNAVLFGDPLVFAYAHKANPVLAGIMRKGAMGFGLPNISHIYGLLFSSVRGLFFISPVLTLTIFMFFGPVRERVGNIARDFDIAIIFVITVTLISGFTDWKAGNSAGPRHLIMLLPFLVEPLSTGMDRLGQWSAGRFAVLVLGFVSVFHIWLVNGTFFYLSDQVANPIYHESVPLLLNACTYPMIFSANLNTGLIAWGAILIITWLGLTLGLFGLKRPLHSIAVFFMAVIMTMVVALSLNTINDRGKVQKQAVYAELNRVRGLRGCRENRPARAWVRLIP